MKYKVIGWTFSDNHNIEDAPFSFAARHAIVDEIKAHGYLFSGEDHQDALYGCPVLNDGKKRACSQRGFAGMMAEARGETDTYAYSKYMFGIKRSAVVAPKSEVDKSAILPQDELVESFEIELGETAYYSALQTGEIVLGDLPALRFVDSGDTLVLVCGKERAERLVLEVDREKDLTKAERLALMMPAESGEEMLALECKLREAKTLLKIKIK